MKLGTGIEGQVLSAWIIVCVFGIIMCRANAALDRAITLAHKSSMTHKHGCVIMKGNIIIGEGYNRRTQHMEHSVSLHSEVVALSSVKNRTKGFLNNSIMIVARVTSHGLRFSSPCCQCRKAIEKSGITKVYFTVDDHPVATTVV